MPRRNYQQKKAMIRTISEKRIENLYKLADENMSVNYGLAQKYAALARNIALRLRIKIPPRYKKRICTHCKQFLRPGVNCRVRIRSQPKRVTVFCKNCRRFMRKNLKK